MSVEMSQVARNLSKVRVGDIDYYSYETVVAFYEFGVGLVCSENIWSQTTGKHLNVIEPDKAKRIPHQKFLEELERVSK